jgi:SAM-dependent methyltransferase
MDQIPVDWNGVWKRTLERSRNQFPKKEKPNFEEAKKNALRYLKGKGHGENMEEILQCLPLSPEIRVLDIGPGPGNMALPMAPRVAHITAVEPDDAMIAVLRDQITERGITNMITIQKKWEDVDIARDLEGPYDLVIASQSLGMPDIEDAINKMCAASRKWVYLFWADGITSWDRRWLDLWPRLYGCEFQIGPRANILYNLLHDMGIYSNVKSERRDFLQTYQDKEEAARIYRRLFNISTPEQETIMQDYLSSNLEHGEKRYFFREKFNAATLWWDLSERG